MGEQLVLRLGLSMAALIGLGATIALSPADAHALEIVAVVLAAVGTLLSIRLRRPAAGAALAMAAAGAALPFVTSTATAVWAFAGLLLASVVLGAMLARILALLLTVSPILAPAGDGRVETLSLDSLVDRELARARRHELPVTVMSISLSTDGGSQWPVRSELAEVVRILSQYLRQTDVLGSISRTGLIALLPDTSAQATAALLDRLRRILDPELAGRVRVGTASFPAEEVTWIGLKALAAERECPLELATDRAAADRADLQPEFGAARERVQTA